MTKHNRPVLINERSYLPHPHHSGEDVFIDMQYARRDCKRPDVFAKEPWKYCRESEVTNTYLGLRFEKRQLFKDNINTKQLKRIEHEEERIQQTRVNFSSNEKRKEIMVNLKKARKEWKQEVQQRRQEYVENVKNMKEEWDKLPKFPRHWNRSQTLDLELLERVKSWSVEDQAEDKSLTSKEEPEYGFKACAMYFKKSHSGYESHTHSNPKFLPGEFPNQKIAVHDLLQPSEDNALSEECPDDILRYFHFPTNSMTWIEKAMARYYGEDDGDHNDHDPKPQSKMTKAEKLLSREFWRGQLHGSGSGPTGPVHARHMRSRCSIIPEDSKHGVVTQPISTTEDSSSSSRNSQQSLSKKPKGKNFAIFLPYLHWETNSRRARMAAVIKEVTAERLEAEKRKAAMFRRTIAKQSEKQKKERTKKGVFDVWQAKNAKEPEKKTKLGKYLLALAQAADTMDYEADERLLRDNLHEDPPLHIRRTLDQSYFLTLEDTATRDKDQVVYRETKANRSSHIGNTRVVMVDQLWLWILDDNTIITSFPRRWGRNKPDPSGVHKSLRERLTNIPAGEIHSIYDIALIIIDQCSRVFFDRTKPLDHRPEVMDIFASAIGNVTEHTTIAYESFWRNMEYRALGAGPENAEYTNHRYLDINPEGTILREAHDIAEELQIMLRIYSQQLHVVKDFRKILGHMNGESKNETDVARNLRKLLESMQNQNVNSTNGVTAGDEEIVPESTIQQANDLLELLRNRQAEIQELEDAALRTSHQLQGLLSLKQQQASIVEAKASLKTSLETVRQGRAIMAFTLVTIFFLPLGFLAAFFGMNNQEINASPWMTLNEQMKYMFSISFAVITIAISMAFSPWTRATLTVLVKVPLAWIAEYTLLRAFWRRFIINHNALEIKGQKKLAWIWDREKRLKKRRKEKEDKTEEQKIERGETVKSLAWSIFSVNKTIEARQVNGGVEEGNEKGFVEMARYV